MSCLPICCGGGFWQSGETQRRSFERSVTWKVIIFREDAPIEGVWGSARSRRRDTHPRLLTNPKPPTRSLLPSPTSPRPALQPSDSRGRDTKGKVGLWGWCLQQRRFCRFIERHGVWPRGVGTSGVLCSPKHLLCCLLPLKKNTSLENNQEIGGQGKGKD